MKLKFLAPFILLLFIASCIKSKPESTSSAGDEGTYFSIKQFIKDQWDIYKGQPFTIQKTVKLNGKTDTTVMGAYDVAWADIFDVFFKTDISDKKFLDRYNFTMFEDPTTQTRNFYYEAKDNKLFTRKLQISADNYSNKVRSIYIETEQSDETGTQTQKLFYIPVKIITIQEYAAGINSTNKDLFIEYRFM